MRNVAVVISSFSFFFFAHCSFVSILGIVPLRVGGGFECSLSEGGGED